jgi:hypothetical protein
MSIADLPNCWIDIFELSRHRGRRRRLYGPADMISLRSSSASWGIGIDSLTVGPGAYVRLYSSREPDKTALWLLPSEDMPDLVQMQVGDEVDSVQILDRAPRQADVGYQIYLDKKKAHH